MAPDSNAFPFSELTFAVDHVLFNILLLRENLLTMEAFEHQIGRSFLAVLALKVRTFRYVYEEIVVADCRFQAFGTRPQ